MKAMENPRIPAWAEVNKSRVLDALRLVDRELATKPFIAGASNSVLVKENVTVSDSYEVTAELPGMDPSNITVKFSTGTLTIKGEKKEEKEEKGKDYVLSERRWGSFQRSFRVPTSIDEEKIEATFSNGVLTIVLPKSAEAQQAEKTIDIKRV